MKKKVFSLMMTLLLAFVGVAKADVVEIGVGGTSTNSYLPNYEFYNYSFTQQLYTADEIGTAGTINSIAFYYTSSATRTLDIYMVNTTVSSFADNNGWITVTAADKVYSGSVTYTANAWNTFVLDTPFEYDGTSNLAVIVDDNSGSYVSSVAAYVFDATGMSLRVYNDYTDYDPTDPPMGSGAVLNVKNQIQLDITPSAGGGGMENQLHVMYYDENGDSVVDALNLGVRPIGAWMAPFEFVMYSEGPTYTVNFLDFTPSIGLFEIGGEELPFQVTRNDDVDLTIGTNSEFNTIEPGVIERQFVAITEGNRAAHIWPIVVEMYQPEIPDVVELAYELGTIDTEFTYGGAPAQITPTVLHNDYTLPFPEIEEGPDAVYKFTVEQDMVLNAYVGDENEEMLENGKVALYKEGDEPVHPMADNNYTGLAAAGAGGSAAAGGAFEAQIGEGTSASGYFPFYSLYNYSLAAELFTAAELEEAGVTTAPFTSLSWNATNSISQDQNNITIWMANVTETQVSATSPLASGMTKVYEGNLSQPTPTGWIEFVFNQGSFAWDGHSNVMILCQRNNGSWTSSIQWQYHNPGFQARGYAYTDGAAYDAMNTSYSFYTSSTTRANIIMKGGSRDNQQMVAEEHVYSAGPVIEGLPLTAGTYYLVASAAVDEFEPRNDGDFYVYINTDEMPCPMVYDEEGNTLISPTPADDAEGIEPGSVTLRWNVPEYATGWRLIFGSTYYPEPNHPQTIMYPEDGSFSNQMANSYTVLNLWNNTNYFWRVEFNNDGCPDGVSSPVWGFTTHLNVPQNLTVVDETVFNDEQVVLNWNAVVDRTYRFYNVYRDGELIGSTQTNNISNTTYTDGPLAYNMEGYTYYVTAVYDEGESAPSNEVTVKVSGYGDVNGHVYEQDGTTGIANATVTMVGQDEFGVNHTYNFTTNGQGYYSGHIYAGSYNGSAACTGYQTIYEPVQGNPVGITYNVTTSPIDYILDENFDPVCGVIAEYYPDSLDPTSPYVKVYWGCGLPGSEIIEDFETGDFSQFDWQVSPSYPWTITTTNPYEGEYCMKSGGAGVASVTSDMSVTVNIPNDGLMSFFAKISCENSWDYGYFYIDGVQKGSFTGNGNWLEKTYDITAGDHTFRWSYQKDSSVNSYDDCFYVDYICFYKQPEPAIPGMTYDFEDGTMQGWTSVDADGDGYGWYMGSEIMTGQTGNNGSNDFVLSQSYYMGSVLYPDNYLVSPQVQLGGIVRFYACAQDASYAAEHFGLAVSTTNTNPSSFTMVQEWTMTAKGGDVNGKPVKGSRSGRAQGNWYEYTVDLSAYSGMGYVAIRHFNCSDMFYLNVDDITIGEPGAKLAETRSLDHYRVYRTNCYNDGPYTEENTVLLASVWVPDTVYIDVEWADLPAGVYKWGVGSVYSGNRGEEIEGEINWSDPVSVGNSRATLTYDFDDSSLQGWTTIDADGDGYNWMNGADLMGTGYGHNGSNDIALSQSYSNSYGALYPDNYLVSPQIQLGGSISFWACAQDNGYAAEHFGVAVSTTNNTSASAFTTIQEWTMAAKGGEGKSGHSRNGDNRAQGNWYQYTVDLSAYSGMGYVAIRHFDCTDWFYLDVDDITIVEGAGGGVGPTPGPGTSNGLQLERESEIVWSNCLDKDMYLNNVTVNVLLNSADSPEGATVSFTNTNEYEQQTYGGYNITLDESGFYAFESFRRGEYNISVRLDGYEPIDETRLIWDNEDLRYVMIEILYGVGDIYVSRTGWAMWDDAHVPGGGGQGGQGGGSGATTFSDNFEAGLGNWTAIDADGDGHNWYHSSESMTYSCYDYTGWGHNASDGFAVSQSYTDCTYDSYDPNNFLVTNQKYSITASSVLNFWADYGNDSYPDHFGVAVATVDNPTANDFTVVWEGNAKSGDATKQSVRHDNDRYQNWRSHSVDLSAYAGQDVYIAFRHFNSYDMYEVYIDDVELTTGAKSDERHFEYYKVMCTSIDGVPIYNHNTVWPFCQLSTNEPYNAPLVEGEHYLCKVAVMYSTGMSEWSEPVEWEYEPCDHWGPVDEVTATTLSQGNHIEWVFEHGFNPYGGDTPGPGGAGDTFSVDFESGMPAGWNVIDGNNDGYTWCLTSAIPSTWTYYSGMTLEWYHGGTNAICSGSYINGVGAITPDEYLVSPMVNIANGSQLSFWVAACDASYPADHFGVFVSDNGTSNWTSVQEWTLTAKKSGVAGGRASRDGDGLRIGTWHNYTVDLSAYAGQKYIAFRHFNCNDQYIMCLDDIELTAGAKGYNAMNSGMLGDVYAFNITDIANFDERVYFLYKLVNDSRFNVIQGEAAGMFIISASNASLDLEEAVNEFIYNNNIEFGQMDKVQAADVANAYKSSLPGGFVNSLMMDMYIQSRENNMCEFADPFCTDNGMYEFPAGVNAGTGEAGPDYDCLYTQPNPAWYYMRIGDPGSMDIHMYSTPQVDIDFCCWGPFDDPTTPCPYGLTEDKVVSCSYSTSWTEHCLIPASAQTGEYYILVITNYSNQACNINFSMVDGNGSTDCGILPPVDIIGFLITMDGEYLAFAGPTDRDYTHEGEFGEHEYCVRPIYPGEMVLPDHNFGWSMGCPVCATNNGQVSCEPGAPIHSDEVDANHIKIWWGDAPAAPVEEWLYYDDGEYATSVGAGGTIYWGTMFPAASIASYAGTSLTKVAVHTSYACNATLNVYLGGNTPGGSPAATQNFTMVGDAEFMEVTLNNPVAIDGTQNLWIMFYQSGETYPADACSDTGDANNRWVSLDGSQWYDLAEAGLPGYGWMIRGFVTNQAKGGEVVSLPEFKGNVSNGQLGHTEVVSKPADLSFMNLAELVKYNVYRADEANGEYTLIGEVTEPAGPNYYEFIDSPTLAGTYYYQVRAYYDNECLSDPAPSALDPTVNYVSGTTTADGLAENDDNVALYPNPTSGNVTIEAAGMSRITVVSILGQVVFDTELKADNYTLNMAQFNAGMYMVRVYTESGVTVKRVTVMQ